MDESSRKVAEGLLQAIQAESHGHHFYMMAAQSTDDPKGKETFERLAAEELDHYNYLRGQYDAIVKTGKPNGSLKLGRQATLIGPNPIFSESIRARIASAHYEMTALSVAIQLELGAKNYYAAQAREATDPEVKALYERLAEWEAGHYNALLGQHDALKEDYWAENGFSPF